ncbi:DUF4386 family protein [Kitasatospora sp. NPDC085879]|uniref:DUF4386 family protein n=1 Tax=Kitasatospora sp. NPDC085879 TaxID=3154769 RepID=UPI003416368B
MLLNHLLYRSRLVPRWIAGWALLAVVPYLADALLVLGPSAPSPAARAALVVPLALNELALALWLLAKGFREPESEHTRPATTPAPVGGHADST